jgi:hypothetical protein
MSQIQHKVDRIRTGNELEHDGYEGSILKILRPRPC